MDTAEAELKRRRERAKLSQRAFRVRQATMLRDLREENARLKSGIKNMVEVSQSNDPTVLRSAIHTVAEAAGLAGEFARRSDLGTAAGSTSSSGHHSFAGTNPTGNVANTLTLSGPTLSEVELQPAAFLTKHTEPVLSNDLGQPQPSCMTFRLDSGLFAVPTCVSRVLEPPLDIAPYLGPNQHTLAAQIYWYCTETTVSLVYQLTGHDSGKMAFAGQHHPVLAAMLRYVSKICSYNYLLAIAEARLEFYRVGSCRADNLAATRDSALLLRQRVEKEQGIEGHDLGEWSTAAAVARAVEGRLHGRALKRLEAAIRNDGTDVDARKQLDAFIHNFWRRSTCFGDGPRWKASYIDKQVAYLVQALA